jgi:(hydroxyamino)benzene mutase
MRYGMFLFLLGLLTGLAEQRFTNMRMGLAAHLEGVMNGIFLVALGAIWTEVRLPHPTYWTAFYGTYVNWLTTTLAAVLGMPPRIRSRQQAMTDNPGKIVWSEQDS